MNSKFLKILICILIKSYSFSQQQIPYKMGRVSNRSACESHPQVRDVKNNNCNFNGFNSFIPVIQEDFDYKELLPNNWKFNLDYCYDDDYGNNNESRSTWFGPELESYNNNLLISNSTAFLIWKKEQRYNKLRSYNSSPGSELDYEFTGTILRSLFKTKEGIFKMRIKLPENNRFWPAFWLYENFEIDIYEFWDFAINSQVCDVYHQFRTNIHNNGRICTQGRKMQVPSNFFSSGYHTVECQWNDFGVYVFVDGLLWIYGRKYYDNPYALNPTCAYRASGVIPARTYNCVELNNMDDCDIYNPWPWSGCAIWNKVYRNDYFPPTNDPMTVIVSNAIHNNNKQGLYNSWNNFSQDNKQMAIDWIEIWQPFKQSSPIFYSLGDLYNYTGGTEFVTGQYIRIGLNGSPASFSNTDPFTSNPNSSRGRPLHFLSTSEIEINGDAEFPIGSFLRAEAFDNLPMFNWSQKGLKPDSTKMGSYSQIPFDLIEQNEKEYLDSLVRNNPNYTEIYNDENNTLQSFKRYSEANNIAVILHPNPATNYIYVDMDDEDFNDVKSMEIINNLGQSTYVTVSKTIDVSGYSNGIYSLKIIYTNGFIVVKPFVKQE
jgi:hypothetical protein